MTEQAFQVNKLKADTDITVGTLEVTDNAGTLEVGGAAVAMLADVSGGVTPFAYVHAAETSNITLGGAKDIGGATLTFNQRMVLTGQTTASENGIRLYDAGDANDVINQAQMSVTSGGVGVTPSAGSYQLVQGTDFTASGSGTGMTITVTWSGTTITAIESVDVEGTGYAAAETLTVTQVDSNALAIDATLTIDSVSSGSYPRSTDADASTDWKQGKAVSVQSGDCAGCEFAYTGSDDPTLDTDSLTFIQSGAASDNPPGSVEMTELNAAVQTQIKDGHTQTTNASAGSTQFTLDSVLVDDVDVVEWDVTAESTTSRESIVIRSQHDGDASTDATGSTYATSNALGATNIAGFAVVTDVNGSGSSQTMRLRCTSTSDVKWTATRRVLA